MLLSSQDFQQFTARITYFERIMKEDRSLLDETQQLITTVQDQKQQLQEQKELLISQQEQYAVLKDKTQAEKDSLQNDLAQKGELGTLRGWLHLASGGWNHFRVRLAGGVR
jgi:peptidoglycan hydrolase CwlO-like protein